MKINCESLVFKGNKPCNLYYKDVKKGSVKVYAKKNEHVEAKTYVEGVDYIVNYENGEIVRCDGSSIPDYTKESPFYGVIGFNHCDYEKWGNKPIMVYADYEFDESGKTLIADLSQAIFDKINLPQIDLSQFANKDEITYVVYGDSISEGADIDNGDGYFYRVKEYIEQKTGKKVNMINASLGGMCSDWGRDNFDERVMAHDPDIVSIGFGMNDMSKGNVHGQTIDFGVKPEDFKVNISLMVEKALKKGSKVLLLSPCRANELWHYFGGHGSPCTAVIEGVAREFGVSYANVTALWDKVLERKDTQSMLVNDINHPEKFGHDVYFESIKPTFK
ncbi:MAG: SGNH/GDSL hydrolase family protein [Oscillospiraceae bacterium]|nr:SGNH/GDSL hydrolase family protein [Oscillospiraceae bacterium]